ncbi:MAG TPA: 4'-phosphopantetheinyl transferase superfamily protein [Gemmatimonadales bacterium]|nr:4'-phosphopantetheinyl transferase superfamily protein [Gemmatimonadales bacterium]
MVEILMTQLDLGPAAVQEAAMLLSGDERLRASRFVRARDRRRFTVARAELRRRLGARLSTPPHTIEFAYGRHGKPFLAGRQGRTGLRFSVSHCDGVGALAFATGREIGVDIEALRAVHDADAIAARLCSAVEWRAYESLAAHQKLRGFLNWWTRKEAVVKAHGGGLCQPLDTFDVSLAPGAPARLLRVAGTGGEDAGWALHAFAPGPHLVGAVAFATAGVERVVVHPLTPPADPGHWAESA